MQAKCIAPTIKGPDNHQRPSRNQLDTHIQVRSALSIKTDAGIAEEKADMLVMSSNSNTSAPKAWSPRIHRKHHPPPPPPSTDAPPAHALTSYRLQSEWGNFFSRNFVRKALTRVYNYMRCSSGHRSRSVSWQVAG